MTPITSPAVARVLPPTVAYAAGLVCEHRPDLADGVREVVLGDAAVTGLDVLIRARVDADDGRGAQALGYLYEVVLRQGRAPTALHGLADLFGLIPRRTAEMRITSGDGQERVGDPTIGDNYYTPESGHAVCGLPGGSWAQREVDYNPDRKSAAEYAAEAGGCLLDEYLCEGWSVVWGVVSGGAHLDGEREAVRRLIPIHAHTVSLDATVRAAWAQAYLNALL